MPTNKTSLKIYKSNYRDAKISHIQNNNHYLEMYKQSINNPENFWSKIADRIHWIKKWTKVSNYNFINGKIKWFENGKLNVSYNCLDRHVEAGFGNHTALIWEGNDPSIDKKYTYSQLLSEVSKFANILKNKGVKKGDRVCIYMQMIPELAIAMLACCRIGAIHSIVFGAFSAESLKDRINDSSCKVLVTQDTGVRGLKQNIPMKNTFIGVRILQ